MNKLTGKIVDKAEPKTSKAGKPYYRVQIDGKWYSTGFKSEVGDLINADISENGQYLSNVEKLNSTPKTAAEAATEERVGMGQLVNVLTRIAVALEALTNGHNGQIPYPNHTPTATDNTSGNPVPPTEVISQDDDGLPF